MNLRIFRMETNKKFLLILVIKQRARWQSDSELIKWDKELVTYLTEKEFELQHLREFWNVCKYGLVDWGTGCHQS